MQNLLTFEEYTELGYSKVKEEQFPRYSSMAVAYAIRLTLGRLYRPDPEDDVWKQNIIGLCELVDAQYAKVNQEDKVLVGFSNSKYSESYASVDSSRVRTSDDVMFEIMELFFTPQQLSRQVIPVRGWEHHEERE